MKLKLIEKRQEARGTKTFFWETETPVEYLPGQYYYFTLPKLNYEDPRGATRHFTIASSPTEGNILRLTTRIREESGFKKTLDELPIGTEIEGEGPSGTLILDEKTKEQMPTANHIFIAGGIGITPFRSFIKYNIDKSLNIPMHLIYSNGDNDFVFKKELEEWDKKYDFIKVNFFNTSKSGHLDEKVLSPLYTKYKSLNPTWWIVGPPAFTTAMEEIMEKMKIASSQIHSEKFTGY
ncbi:MAG TPA: FAD-dependent oxidoreductase [Patescibacteria group bacterium]|nr:FAD-dependent oxidoreductase [Patescibacteria group bacterium]